MKSQLQRITSFLTANEVVNQTEPSQEMSKGSWQLYKVMVEVMITTPSFDEFSQKLGQHLLFIMLQNSPKMFPKTQGTT